jgi:hypothetical protein
VFRPHRSHFGTYRSRTSDSITVRHQKTTQNEHLLKRVLDRVFYITVGVSCVEEMKQNSGGTASAVLAALSLALLATLAYGASTGTSTRALTVSSSVGSSTVSGTESFARESETVSLSSSDALVPVRLSVTYPTSQSYVPNYEPDYPWADTLAAYEMSRGTLTVFVDGARLRSEDPSVRSIVVQLDGAVLSAGGIYPRDNDASRVSLLGCITVSDVTSEQKNAASSFGVYSFTDPGSGFDVRSVSASLDMPMPTHAFRIVLARLEDKQAPYPYPLAGPASSATDARLNITVSPTCFVPQARTVTPAATISVVVSPPLMPRAVPHAAKLGFTIVSVFGGVAAAYRHQYTMLALWPALDALAIIDSATCNLRSDRNGLADPYLPGEAPYQLSLTPYANLVLGTNDAWNTPLGAVTGNFLVWLGWCAAAAIVARLQATRHGYYFHNTFASLRLPSSLFPVGMLAAVGVLPTAIVGFRTMAAVDVGVAIGITLMAGAIVAPVVALLVIGLGSLLQARRAAHWYWYADTLQSAAAVVSILEKRLGGPTKSIVDDPRLQDMLLPKTERRVVIAPPVKATRGVTFAELSQSLGNPEVTAVNANSVCDHQPRSASRRLGLGSLLSPATDDDDAPQAALIVPADSDDEEERGAVNDARREPEVNASPLGADDDVVVGDTRTAPVPLVDPVSAFLRGEGFWADHCFDYAPVADKAREDVLNSRLKRPWRMYDALAAAHAAVPPQATPWRCGFEERFGYVFAGYRDGAIPLLFAGVCDPVLTFAMQAIVYGWRPAIGECHGGLAVTVVALIALRMILLAVIRPYRTPHANAWAAALAFVNLLAAVFATVYHEANRVTIGDIAASTRPTNFWALEAAGAVGLITMALAIVMQVALMAVAVGEVFEQAVVRSAVRESNARFYDAMWAAREARRADEKESNTTLERARRERIALRRVTRELHATRQAEKEAAHRQLLQAAETRWITDDRAADALARADVDLDGVTTTARPSGGRKAALASRRLEDLLLNNTSSEDDDNNGDGRGHDALEARRRYYDADTTLAAHGLGPRTLAAPVAAAVSPSPLLEVPQRQSMEHATASPPPNPLRNRATEYSSFDADFDAAVSQQSRTL